jgi:prepilin-type processing-associated H-X9-DG protein
MSNLSFADGHVQFRYWKAPKDSRTGDIHRIQDGGDREDYIQKDPLLSPRKRLVGNDRILRGLRRLRRTPKQNTATRNDK